MPWTSAVFDMWKHMKQSAMETGHSRMSWSWNEKFSILRRMVEKPSKDVKAVCNGDWPHKMVLDFDGFRYVKTYETVCNGDWPQSNVVVLKWKIQHPETSDWKTIEGCESSLQWRLATWNMPWTSAVFDILRNIWNSLQWRLATVWRRGLEGIMLPRWGVEASERGLVIGEMTMMCCYML